MRRIDERGNLVIGNLTERGELVIGNLTATGRIVFPAVTPVPPIPPAPPIFDGGGGSGGSGIWHSHQPLPHPLPRPRPLLSRQRRHCVLSLPGALFSDEDLVDLVALDVLSFDDVLLIDNVPAWVLEEALLLAPRRPRRY